VTLKPWLPSWRRTAAALPLLSLAIGPQAAVAAAPASFEYPGLPPGEFKASVQEGTLLLTNAAMSAGWTFADGRLRPLPWRSGGSGESLALAGEVFQIDLGDGSRYSTLDLVAVGTPRLRKRKSEPGAAQLARQTPGVAIELPLRSSDGRLRLNWRAIALHGTSYVRQEIEVRTAEADCVIREVVWCGGVTPGAQPGGEVSGSPVVAGTFFYGCEDPNAENRGDGCRLRRGTELRRGDVLTTSFVVGVAPTGQMRRAFLHYVEHERAHPYRPFLHYNSWYDLSWPGVAMNATNCLEAIRAFATRLTVERGVVLDSTLLDDGWDDPKSLWKFHAGFPRGFAPHAALCRRYHLGLGVWLSPFGGYGQARDQRLRYGSAQGYETNAAGFSLAGPRYQAAFRRACVDMIRRYSVNHFKFDGIASGTYARGAGADYLLDTEAMRRLMLDLRRERPGLWINLTTGSWPSPFWLRYADSVWRQGGDMGFAGKGSRQQQWLTYRDQEVYRNIVLRAPLFPLTALMTQGVAYSAHGDAGDPTFDARGFRDDVRAFFGSGTGLQELYVQPGRLRAEDWDVLAEAAHWSRANADVLVDSHWIGGDPAKHEVYGYGSWGRRQGGVMLRNPDDQPHDFHLDVEQAFELPPGAPRSYQLKSAWSGMSSRGTQFAEAGQALTLTLQPFEVLVLDAIPAGDPDRAKTGPGESAGRPR
jgi:hypothetical protein